MPATPTSIGHARLQQTPAGLRIVIPGQGSWFDFFCIPVAAVLVLWFLQLEQEDSTIVLVVVGAVLAFSFRKWLWGVLGREVIIVNKSALSSRRDIAGIGWQSVYFVDRISSLEYIRVVTNTDLQLGLKNRPSVGYVGFQYGSEKHRFAGTFSEAKARELIAVLESSASAPLAATRTIPDHPLPSGTIAEEVHRGRGGLLLYGGFGGLIYAIGMPFAEITAVRIVSAVLAVAFVVVGVMAESGYRYRFTRGGLEIFTLGFRLRFVPADQIIHYEQAKWTLADRWNFGIFGRRRCYLWGGPGVRIQTLDGQIYLGHEKPQNIVADLDGMRQSGSTTNLVCRAASAGPA